MPLLNLVALLIIFTLIIFEKFSRRKSKRWSENPASKDSQGWELKKTRALLAITISLFPPIFSFGIPCFWVLLNIDQIQKGLASVEIQNLNIVNDNMHICICWYWIFIFNLPGL